MASALSPLVLKIGTSFSGVTRGLNKVIGSVKSFSSKVTKYLSIGGAISAALGGVGFSVFIKNSLEAIDVTGKLAARIGTTTEALGGLQHAANLSGVSNEALTGGIEKMLRTLGDAVGGSATAQKAFTNLGLDFNELAKLPADVAIGKIADKLNQIKSPAEKAAATVAIFGRSGQALLPLLSEGSKGISAMTREAAALGKTFSKADFLKVQDANDSLTRVWESIKGIGISLAVALAPGLKIVADRFTQFGIKANSAFKKFQPQIEKAVTWIADHLVSGLMWGLKIIRAWGIAWGAVFNALWSGVKSIVKLFGYDLDKALSNSGGTAQTFGKIVTAVLKGIVMYFAAVAVVIENWKSVFKLVFTVIQLQLVKFRENFKWVFTTALPAYISHLASNFKRIFGNMAQFGGDVFMAMFKAMTLPTPGNIKKLANTITAGFSTAFNKVPPIKPRAITGDEKKLKAEITKLGGELGTKLKDRINKALADIQLPSLDFSAKGKGLWGTLFDIAKKMANPLKPMEESAKKTLGLWGRMFEIAKGMAATSAEPEDPVKADKLSGLYFEGSASAQALRDMPQNKSMDKQMLDELRKITKAVTGLGGQLGDAMPADWTG